jgi:hypothetical protein
MSLRGYQIAVAAPALLVTALLLAGQPPSLRAGRPDEVQLAANAAFAASGDLAADLSQPELPDELAAYRQAIEDVLPLMRSLQARGDTVRLAQLARSVIEVWDELESIQPEAMQDGALHEVIAAWASRVPAPSRRQDPADR